MHLWFGFGSYTDIQLYLNIYIITQYKYTVYIVPIIYVYI